MNVGELCARQVVTCDPNASAWDVASLMRQHHVGDVVVAETADGGRRPVGIITDRDLVMQVMARRVEPERVTAADLMSPVVTALATEGVYDAIWHMRRQGCRRLPLVDASGALVGLATVDDLTQFLAEEFVELARVSPRQRQIESERLDPAR